MAVQTPELILPTSTVRFRSTRRWPSPQVWLPAAVLIVVAGACFLGPIVGHLPGPNAGSLTQARLAPLTAGHLLGTDDLGNDILSRCLYGGRVSIEVGLGSVSLGLVVGGALGMLAGYRGGVVDSIIMRILDMFLAFPSLVLALAVATYLGPNEQDVIFAIAFFTVPAYARLARASTLRLREQGFIVSARLIGQKDRDIITQHVVPNILPSLVTFGVLTIGLAMIIEAALDFLGVGVRAPEPSWGSMIAGGQQNLSDAPWIVLMPGAFLFLTVMSLNLLADALRSKWEAS
jgi:peptide/nickel transport system permease protein